MQTRCPICGLGDVEGCPNRLCWRADRGFSVVFSASPFCGAARKALTRYKYRNVRQLAPVLASLLADHVRANPTWFEEFDVITAVPAYVGQGARRRWSPVGELLRHLGPRLGDEWIVDPALVVKTTETPALTGLSYWDRHLVAQGALRSALSVPGPAAVQGRQILVVDDVMTDGATMREVALALRAAGAADVAGLVVARRAWNPEGACSGG